MPFEKETIEKIEEITINFFDEKIFTLEANFETVKKGYPWHSIFFTPEAAVAALKERSLVTSIGQSFVPHLAFIVAEDRYDDVHREYQYNCQLDRGAVRQIETICRELRGERGNRTRVPDHNTEMAEIAEAKNGEMVDSRLVLDLYVGDHKDGPLYYEIKSPKPNLDQTELAKRKILQFMSVSPDHQGYYALHYNPYITKDAYNWQFTKSIMDLDNQVLIGEEMWNHLGDENTYNEILEILSRISEEKWAEFDKK